ncbi:Mur ligase [Cylindrobasidium torrendii FP15055 ss-10]|uniref:Mur ligase n=1 Tax=Cylindrobasidium torrendii FP15055 ss-10 TaxID=1314674 RepID=A0A0D7BMQ3_9AGAR|nr:Mur ligase [Cylindrobasidium torrendii FP15055 ss-10]
MSIDLTLDRIRAVMNLLPAYTRPTIHIAGTNGKGSVSALVSSILSADTRLSVGRFNSPHLVTIYDSITINNSNVDPNVYAAAQADVEGIAHKHDLAISSFETLTLVALLVFERAKVDYVVLEVGMGGRLDATNVIPDDVVVASALTAVDLDHQTFLGGTIDSIAREKVAIARHGKPFVLGSQSSSSVRPIVEAHIQAIGGKLIEAPHVEPAQVTDFGTLTPWRAPACAQLKLSVPWLQMPIVATFPLHGSHQYQNLGTALGLIGALVSNDELRLQDKLTALAIGHGIENTTWRGRLSFQAVTTPRGELPVLVDGAHNQASAETLAAYLTNLLHNYPSDQEIELTFILSLSHSPPKRPLDTLAPLFPLGAPRNIRTKAILLEFSPPEGMPWIKCEDIDVVKNTILELAPGTDITLLQSSGEEGLVEALALARTEKDSLAVVAGSLYLVSDFYRATA